MLIEQLNPLWWAFALASLLLALTPGPGVFFIVSRTLAEGPRAGLLTVAGVALGNCGNALGAGVGLAALFSVSAMAFTVVKFAGAAYLFYLAYAALKHAPQSLPARRVTTQSASRLFSEGFWVALLNPKTTMFFAAFLPQFMNPAASPFGQSLLLGGSFVFIAAITDSAYVLAAGRLRASLGDVTTIASVGRYAKAMVYIGLGLFAAVSGQRTQVSTNL